MKKSKSIYQELYNFFQPEQYKDVVRNGLLADNTDIIEKVYTATFSSSQVLEKIKQDKAKNCLLFTHHPGAQRKEGETPDDFTLEDRAYMQEHHISHFNLHLPLDNVNPYSPGVSLARALGAVPYKSFFEEGGSVMGLYCSVIWTDAGALFKEAEKLMGHACRLYTYGSSSLEDGKIALVAGGAEGTDIYREMKKEGINLFLTGVGSKNLHWFAPSHEAAAETGVSILSAGHYSTEQFALKDICRFFRERGLEAEFIPEIPLLEDL
ncbi:MAG: hypothetical protein HFG95_05645 [Dorea sp.]|nr:hypothetical protein [Dorea sp.]